MNPDLEGIAARIADERDCDVILYNGEIERPWDRLLADHCGSLKPRPNVLLVLVTHGGDPHAAYRMARCLEQQYEHFKAFVIGPCKSAGTLFVMGAHSLVMSDGGELGPLDVQMRKPDELAAADSVLTVSESMANIEQRLFRSFQHFFLHILRSSAGQISFRTATQVSTELVVGLYKPLVAQIDPMLLGEAARAMQISSDYVKRLAAHGGNVNLEEVSELVAAFSSHGFVIDRDEAMRFFNRVEEPDELERELEAQLKRLMLDHAGALEGDPIWVLSESTDAAEEGTDEYTERDDDADSTAGSTSREYPSGEAESAGSPPGDSSSES